MQQICPISFNRINEYVARINGLITVTIAVSYLLTGIKLLPLLLFVDFFMRGFHESKYSLMASISKKIVELFKLKKRMINAGPKIFAAQVGALLTGFAVLAHYFEIPALGFATISILAFFSFLEAAFGICVACKIYPLIRKYSPEYFDAGL